MSIHSIISRSVDFNKLCILLNTPIKNRRDSYCTISHTTIDSRNIIFQLIEEKFNKSFIYTTLSSHNIIRYLDSITINKILSFGTLKNILKNNTFIRENKVNQYGDYSVKGDIISFWPSIYPNPIRIQFFGDEIESIEMYDAAYQNTLGKLYEVAIGNESNLEDNIERDSVQITSFNKKIHQKILIFANMPGQYKNRVNLHIYYPSLYFKRLDIFEKELLIKKKQDWRIFISTCHKDNIPRTLQRYVKDMSLKSGFESSKMKIAVYTDREIFGTIFIASEKARSSKRINKYLSQLEGEIEIDNYIQRTCSKRSS